MLFRSSQRDKTLYEIYMDSRTKAGESLERQKRQTMSEAEAAGRLATDYRSAVGMPGASDEDIYGLAQAIRANNAQARSLEPQRWLEYAEGLEQSQAEKQALTEKGRELGRRAAAASEQGRAWEYSNIIKGYGNLINSPDFATKSRYVVPKESADDIWKKDKNDPLLRYMAINGDRHAQIAFEQEAWSTGDDSGTGNIFDLGGDNDYLFELTETEKGIYNALYASSPDAAENFIEKLKPYLELRARETFTKRMADVANDGTKGAVGASIISVGANLGQSGEYILQLAELLGKGKINQNSAAYRASQMSGTFRSEVSKKIEENWGKEWSTAYQLGMSMADFISTTVLFGSSKAVDLALMGTRAAASTTLNLKDRGLDDASAFTLGTIAGAAEIVTESFSLEQLLNPDLVADSIAKYLLKNFLAEASEEGAADLINWAAERIYDAITGNNEAEWKQNMYAAIQAGADPNDAALAAIQSNLVQLGMDMLGGGISGGIMAGTLAPFYVNAFNNSEQGQYANAIRGDEEGLQALIQSGLESPQGTESRQRAEKMEYQVAKGKTPSTLDIARLVEANQQQINSESGQGRFRLTLPQTTQSAPRIANAPTPAPARTAENNSQLDVGNATETNISAAEPTNATEANTPPIPGDQASPIEQEVPQTAQETQERPGLTLPRTPEKAAQATLTLPSTANDIVAKLKASKPGLLVDDYANSKLSVSEMSAIDETARRFGLRVGFVDPGMLGDANAKILLGDRVVLIEKGNTNPIQYLYGHEIGHFIKQLSPDDYNEFAKAARATDPEWFKNREAKYVAKYRELGKNVSPEEMQEEILCDYAGWMVNNEDVLNRFIEQNRDKPNILRRLYEAIKALAAKLTGKDKQNADRAVDLLLKAMNATEANAQNGIMSTGERSSFAGIKAVYADEIKRQEAEQTLQQRDTPTNRNKVRKKTGWFKGGDGKWRFEIDDSGSSINVDEPLKHIGDNSKYFRLAYTLYDYNNSSYFDREENLTSLSDWASGEHLPKPSDLAQKFASGNGTVGDILDHEELYRQYPFIAETRLNFEDLGKNTMGRVKNGEITLNTSLLSDVKELRSTLLHEIQHMIQDEEGFASGSNEAYWQRQIERGVDTTRPSEVTAINAFNKFKKANPGLVSAASRLDQMHRQIWDQYKPVGNGWMNRETGEVVPQETIWGEYEQLERTMNATYGKKVDQYYNILADLGASPLSAEEEVAKGPSKRTAFEMYEDTYGEAEARNVQLRAEMPYKFRENSMPYAGHEDSVFVERDSGGTNSSVESSEKYWHTGFSKQDVLDLEDTVRYDIGVSNNAITDTANWYYSDKNGKPVFAIYSTEDQSNPTILYASRGGRAKYEAAYTQAIAKEFNNGTDETGETFDSWSQAVWGQRGPGDSHAHDTIYSGNAAGNDALDGGAPRSKPGRALINVLQNLSQSRDGGRRTDDAKSSLKGLDADYTAALDDGNIAKAAQLVHETADSAMPDSKVRNASTGELRYVYHYTNKNFYEFKPMGQSAGSNRTLGDGYYVSTSETEFKSFGKNKMRLFANITNPFEMELTEEQAQEVYDKYFRPYHEDKFHTYEPYVVGKLQSYSQVFDYLKEAAEKNGTTTSAILSELGFDGVHSGPEWVAFKPEQLKSADVVTYDDDGQMIPLSERFDPNKTDTRNSLKGLDADTAPASMQNKQTPSGKNDRVERLKFKYEQALEEQKGKTFQANAQRNSDLARQRREFQEKSAEQRERANERLERTRFKYEQAIEEQKGKTFQERARRYSELAAQKREFQEKQAKSREARRAQDLRGKIESHTKSLLAEYQHPNNKHHVPENLRGAVNAVLSAINMSSGYSLAEGENGKQLHVPIGEGVAETKRTQAFAQLRSELENERQNLAFDWSMIDDADGAINRLIGEMADIPIANMNSEQLQTVYDVLRGVEHAIKTADKMLSAARAETVSGFSNALLDENGGKKQALQLNGALGRALQHVSLDILTPEAYFHRLGDSGKSIFKMLRGGQDNFIRTISTAADATKNILKDADVRKLETDEHKVTLGGNEVTMSTAQLMELYCLMARDQGMQHITTGGIVVEPSKRGVKKNAQLDPIHPSVQELNDAIDMLTPDQIRMAEAMQKYLTEDMSALGNEATMQVYGYKKFGQEDNYWKIRSNKNELQSDPEKFTQTTSVANKGFTKATKPNANTSVLIGSAFDTFSQSISDMASYASWLAISEDMNRVLNYTFWGDDGNRITTIQSVLDRVQGSGGANYFKQLMADIANGVQNDAGLTEGFVGAYKAAAIGNNIRVIAQQPTAILRAMEMIDPKYFANIKDPFKAFERAKKYAPIAQWKDWGYFDINTGRKMKDVLMESSESALEKARQASMAPAGKADSWAWGILWNAVERETAKTTDLTPGSEEFYHHCAERFSDIIDHTQVVDGILQRSPIQRSTNSINKMASSFMSEPLKQYGQFMSAVYDVKAGKKGAGKHLVRTAMAMAAAGLLNNAVQSLVDALRDDDKEKKYWEKFLEKSLGYNSDDDTMRKKIKTFLGSNMGELINPAEYIPYAKDVMSIYKGYDVERMDMSIVSDLVTSVNRLKNTLAGDTKYTAAYAVASVTEQLAKLTGLPAANIDRDIKSVINTVANEADMPLLQYYMNRYRFKPSKSGNLSDDLTNILWSAKQKGDEDYQAVYDRLIKDGYSEEKINDAMMTKMSETTGLTQAIKDADAANNGNKSYDTLEILSAFESLDLPQDEAETLLEWKLSDEQWEKYTTLKDADIKYDTRFDIMRKYSELYANDELDSGDKALEFSHYVDGLNITGEQAQVVKDTYKFWTQVPAQATNYEKFKGAGLDEDKSKYTAELLGALQPLPGKKEVTDLQRYRAIEADKELTTSEKIKVIGSIMGTEMVTETGKSTQWAKFNTALNNGQSLSQAIDLYENERLDEFEKWTTSAAKGEKVPWDVYDKFLKDTARFDGKDDNGKSVEGLKKEKVVAYIEYLDLTIDQKKALLKDYNKEYKDNVRWHNGSYGSGYNKDHAPAKLRLPEARRATPTRLQLPYTAAGPQQNRLKLR